MKSLTDTFQLRNKVEIPCIGYGTDYADALLYESAAQL